MKNFIDKIKQSQLFSLLLKVSLIMLDILIINMSSYLALWLRFNMRAEDIEIRYLVSIIKLMPLNTIITVGIFGMAHLYTSLWRFASIKELV